MKMTKSSLLQTPAGQQRRALGSSGDLLRAFVAVTTDHFVGPPTTRLSLTTTRWLAHLSGAAAASKALKCWQRAQLLVGNNQSLRRADEN